MNIKQVIKYAVMPGIIPRAKNLFTSGFGYIAFLMACVYNIVRLLPNNHPYLQPKNIGLFGVHHVIAEAANNIVLSKRNIDQIFVFLILLTGVVLMCLQFALLIYAYIVQPALATSIFATPVPTSGGPLTDIAFLLLDNVFGIPDFFCTPGTPPTCTDILASGPLPFHIALHAMFQFYSTGILIIGVIIFIYLIIAVILETATTGTPFGQRFQNVWVPIRLIVALGLLVPINFGLNSGQYITLAAAKYGSGFATNAWIVFNKTIQANTTNANPLGEETSLVAKPAPPDISTLVQFMSIVHSCAYTHWKQNLNGSDPTTASSISGILELAPNKKSAIQAYMVKNVDNNSIDDREIQKIETGQTYTDAVAFYDNANVTIVFGIDGSGNTSYNKFTSNVEPTCGEIQIPISDLSQLGNSASVGGADQMQHYYFNLVKAMWFGSVPVSIGGSTPSSGNSALIINTAHRKTELSMGTDPPPAMPNCLFSCNPTKL